MNNLVTNSQRSVPISLESAEEIVKFLLGFVNQKKMAVHFVGKKKIAKIHGDFFNDPSPTDCISFPYNEPDFLGEIFVCPQVAKEYVEKNGGELSDEITLYIVHGFLHLLGYDDQTEKERKKMRAAEKKWCDLIDKIPAARRILEVGRGETKQNRSDRGASFPNREGRRGRSI